MQGDSSRLPQRCPTTCDFGFPSLLRDGESHPEASRQVYAAWWKRISNLPINILAF